jgi:hypothetical protein
MAMAFEEFRRARELIYLPARRITSKARAGKAVSGRDNLS